jgi:hypothetical protein
MMIVGVAAVAAKVERLPLQRMICWDMNPVPVRWVAM